MAEVNNAPAVLPMRQVRGDKWAIPWTKTNSPVSMAGWTFLFQVRAEEGRGSTLITTLSVDTTDAASGTVLFTKPAADTEALTPGAYFYELARTDTGFEKTYLKGRFTIDDDTADL